MLKSVKLADEARKRFIQEQEGINSGDVRIALSLGPYGASLIPAQEFDGFYPPPYGPKAFSNEGDNCNAFDDTVAVENSINALARFHLERLRVFAQSPEAWSKIDCIALETVPLAREVRAIRKAFGILQKERGDDPCMKPWWISLVFPYGRYPETQLPGGQNLNVRQVAEAAFGNESPSYPPPNGIGLNCMQTDYFLRLLSELQEAVGDLCKKRTTRPWLVMYPNGGDVYDPVSRTWQVRADVGKAGAWADKLGEIVDEVAKQRTWGGVLVGGCCRTGPEEISALSCLLSG
jgi:homocysteine S-methyltransferase